MVNLRGRKGGREGVREGGREGGINGFVWLGTEHIRRL